MGQATAVGEEFDAFYAAHFRDTVAMAYTLTANMVEAQDIAQEAFCRERRRWPHIRGYENMAIGDLDTDGKAQAAMPLSCVSGQQSAGRAATGGVRDA
jgi:hypothetical protein